MASLTVQDNNEAIIRFSWAWWQYILFKGGFLRGLVGFVEDAISILGRFFLLAFIVYSGVKGGLLLSDPQALKNIPAWLEMLMFGLQLAGLEGSIPGLARQGEIERLNQNEKGAERIEFSMKAARGMTIAALGEIALHLLQVDATFLQWAAAILLVARGFVITGFLIELARVDSKGPKVISLKEYNQTQQEKIDKEHKENELAAKLEALHTKMTEELELSRQAMQRMWEKIEEVNVNELWVMMEGQTSTLAGLENRLIEIEATTGERLEYMTQQVTSVKQETFKYVEGHVNKLIPQHIESTPRPIVRNVVRKVEEVRNTQVPEVRSIRNTGELPAVRNSQVRTIESAPGIKSKADFIRTCLAEDITMSTSEINRRAQAIQPDIRISAQSISDVRASLKPKPAKTEVVEAVETVVEAEAMVVAAG